jgi:hypothetical protein
VGVRIGGGRGRRWPRFLARLERNEDLSALEDRAADKLNEIDKYASLNGSSFENPFQTKCVGRDFCENRPNG